MNKFFLIASVLLISIQQACKPDNPFVGDCFIPNQAVNVTINMDLPAYFNLQTLGEYLMIDQGNRGIYLIHNYDDLYYAIERTCPYQSDQECAQVFLDENSLQLVCGQQQDTAFVPCCGTIYGLNSLYLSGPARCNLKTYRLTKQGKTLYINN